MITVNRFHLLSAGIAMTLFFGVMAQAERHTELTAIADKPQASDFTLPDIEGNPHQLSDYRGKVIIVSFWATWCAPCRKEMPSMQRAWEQQLRDQGGMLLAINWKDSEDAVATFREDIAMDFPILMDKDGSVASQWGVRGLPANFVVDPEGRLVYQAIGEREWDNPELLEKILALRNE